MANFLTRIGETLFSWGAALEQRSSPAVYVPPVQVSYFPVGGAYDPSMPIGRADTISVTAIWQAIGLISDTVAGLPFGVYQQDDKGLSLDRTHPAHRLLSLQTDDYTISFDFFRALIANALLGDGYARVYRDSRMRPVRMQIVVGTVRVAYAKSGEPYYLVRDTRTGWNYDEEVVPAYDMLHLRNRTLDGMKGLPVEQFFRHVLAANLAAQQHEAAFFANGAHVDKVVEHPKGLTLEQVAQLENRFKKYSGPNKSGSTMVIDDGMKLSTVGLNLEQAAVVPTRRFHVEEVARILNVTPAMLHALERATFNNVEELGRSFVTYTLQPWIKQLEQQCARVLLTEREKDAGTHYTRMTMQALLRGNVKDRTFYYVSMLQNGVMSPNEVRELENMNPREGGDDYMVPLNMQVSGDQNPDDLNADPANPDPQTDTQNEPDASK